MPEIELAIEGKTEWLKMTTPGVKNDKPKSFDEFISTVKAMPGTKVYGK